MNVPKPPKPYLQDAIEFLASSKQESYTFEEVLIACEHILQRAHDQGMGMAFGGTLAMEVSQIREGMFHQAEAEANCMDRDYSDDGVFADLPSLLDPPVDYDRTIKVTVKTDKGLFAETDKALLKQIVGKAKADDPDYQRYGCYAPAFRAGFLIDKGPMDNSVQWSPEQRRALEHQRREVEAEAKLANIRAQHEARLSR